MAKYYNCSDNFLWRKGIEPILFWFSVGFGGYLLVMLLHKPIVNIKNTILTLSWALFTLILLIAWIKKTNKKSKIIESWTDGFIRELLIRRTLLKLNGDVYVLYDVKLSDNGGNIDFVVINAYGVFAIEVKKKYVAPEHRKQTKRQAVALQKYLQEKGVNIDYVEPILIYALRDGFSRTDNDNLEILGRKDVRPFFNKNLPARKNKSLEENDISKIIQVLI